MANLTDTEFQDLLLQLEAMRDKILQHPAFTSDDARNTLNHIPRELHGDAYVADDGGEE